MISKNDFNTFLGQEKSRQHDYYSDSPSQGYQGNSYSNWNQYSTNYKKASSNSVFEDIILLIVAAIILYALYKTCFSNRDYTDREYR